MKIRNVVITLFSIINAVRILPLFFLWKLKLLFNDENAYKFYDDLIKAKYSFFITMYLKPQYKTLLYARLGNISYLVRWFCGSYPVYIDSKNTMSLGKGVWMEHPHGSHLHAKRIGENLTIKQNVTIGLNKGKLPIVGNNVFCGSGACILGGVIIGDNVNIGAGCVVVKDVPDNCTVIGNPAYITRKDGQKVHIPLS